MLAQRLPHDLRSRDLPLEGGSPERLPFVGVELDHEPDEPTLRDRGLPAARAAGRLVLCAHGQHATQSVIGTINWRVHGPWYTRVVQDATGQRDLDPADGRAAPESPENGGSRDERRSQNRPRGARVDPRGSRPPHLIADVDS